MSIRGLAIGIVCAFAAAAARGEGWPEFRGPGGRGVSMGKGLPDRWSSTENVVWKREIPGSGWSSPVVHAGRIYLTAAIPQGDEANGDYDLCALALEEETGNLLWSMPVFTQSGGSDAKIHQKNSHASPTPLIDGGRLFVHFGHQGTACLAIDGTILWKNDRQTYAPVHGNGGSPVLVEGALLFSCDGAASPYVVALDADTGTTRWKVDRPVDAVKKFSFSTPAVIEVEGKTQVVSPGSDVVSAFDPLTGREIWRVGYEGYSVIPQPGFAHGLVFVCTGYNSPELLAIRADGTGDVTETHVAWRAKRGVPNTPSPVIVEDDLYMVSDQGVASCLDARTGKVQWQKRLGGNFSASPLAADGKLFFQNEEGNGYVLPLGGTVGEPITNPLGERTLATYAISDRSLVIRAERHLYRIRTR